MIHDSSSFEHYIVIFEGDGSRSEPITPRGPSEQARIAKLREKYAKAHPNPALLPTADQIPPPEREDR